MSTVEFRTLENESPEAIHRCFAGAFADYVIKVDFTIEKYRRHVIRYGVEPQHSMGAYSDGRMVGFILNATGTWNGKRTIYDAGTGVVPEARGQGLTRRIFERLKEHAIAAGFEQYLLEVIQSNAPALSIYEKQGFVRTRELCCFKGPKDSAGAASPFEAEEIGPLDDVETFWEAPPSWQNSTVTVERCRENLQWLGVRLDGGIAGYAVFSPDGGEILQMAVRPDARGRGVGGSLLAGVARRSAAADITVLNIEKGARAAVSFWGHRLPPYVDQFEMALALA
jgi:ribosomal protein S18 acetylase RimI-like enzyme